MDIKELVRFYVKKGLVGMKLLYKPIEKDDENMPSLYT